jgi:hypothetical protein
MTIREGTTSQAAEKVVKLSFRGRRLPEESAFFSSFDEKQIPRFARNDSSRHFSAACSVVPKTRRKLRASAPEVSKHFRAAK